MTSPRIGVLCAVPLRSMSRCAPISSARYPARRIGVSLDWLVLRCHLAVGVPWLATSSQSPGNP